MHHRHCWPTKHPHHAHRGLMMPSSMKPPTMMKWTTAMMLLYSNASLFSILYCTILFTQHSHALTSKLYILIAFFLISSYRFISPFFIFLLISPEFLVSPQKK